MPWEIDKCKVSESETNLKSNILSSFLFNIRIKNSGYCFPFLLFESSDIFIAKNISNYTLAENKHYSTIKISVSQDVTNKIIGAREPYAQNKHLSVPIKNKKSKSYRQQVDHNLIPE